MLIDLYELTMMYGYFQSGIIHDRTVFDMFYRYNPFNGGYSVFAGLEQLIEYIENIHFSDDDIQYLESLDLFSGKFLGYLRQLRFKGNLSSFEEGDIIFPEEPIIRVEAELGQAQFLESSLLNCINFQCLIATKGGRVCSAAGGKPVIEFGVRRAQGVDGGVSASRAAFVGGCASTSNVLAGKMFDIPVKGTHAHSWVMAFDSEKESFQAYADVYPDKSILLVDTYDTLDSGLPRAIEVAKNLKESGYELLGIRLDSGDLHQLAIESRKVLDGEGLDYVKIVASNDLDEYRIHDLVSRGAPIDIFGVGTRLATGHNEAAFPGVYKMSAMEKEGTLTPRMKISDQITKGNIPAIKNIYRCYDADNTMIFDIVCEENESADQKIAYGIFGEKVMLQKDYRYEKKLVSIYDNGRLVYSTPPIKKLQDRFWESYSRLPVKVKDVEDPGEYPIYVSEKIYTIIDKLRKKHNPENNSLPKKSPD